jgi:hypothetical protein
MSQSPYGYIPFQDPVPDDTGLDRDMEEQEVCFLFRHGRVGDPDGAIFHPPRYLSEEATHGHW